jgi:hypothetical protein
VVGARICCERKISLVGWWLVADADLVQVKVPMADKPDE